jgi:hypothetical protein
MSKGALIAVLIFALFLGGVVAYLSGAAVPISVIKQKVADSAAKYCNDLNMDFVGGSSTGRDGNPKDGYISIDARCKDRSSAKVERLNLECTWSMVGFQTGCKEKVSIRNQMNKS